MVEMFPKLQCEDNCPLLLREPLNFSQLYAARIITNKFKYTWVNVWATIFELLKDDIFQV